MRVKSNRRRGVTILLGTVVLVLLVIAVVGLTRHIQASRVAAGAEGAAVGALAMDAAQSAIEEALAAIAVSANTKGTPLFEALRAERPVLRPLVIGAPVCAKALDSDPLTRELDLEGAGVRVSLLAIGAAGDTSMDRKATLELSATVRHASTGIVRRVRRKQGARVALLTAPRPFDQFTYITLDAAPLIDPGTNAALGKTLDWMRDLRDVVGPKVGGEARDLLDRINRAVQASGKQDVAALVGPFNADRLPAPPAFTTSVVDEYHYLPAGLVLFTKEPALADLALAYQAPGWQKRTAEVETNRTRFTAARATYDAALEKVKRVSDYQAAGFSISAVTPAFDAWKQALKDLGQALTALEEAQSAQLADHHAYTQRWGELAGAAREGFVKMGPVLSVDAFARRAEHTLRGPDAPEQLRKLLQKYASTGLQATVHLDTTTPLDVAQALSGRPFKGRLVLSTAGPVSLRDVSVADLASDLLVICAGGEMTVAGTVRAALIAHDGFVSTPDATLSGLLIQPEVTQPAGLHGRLVNDGRFYSAGTGSFHPAFAQVSLSPWADQTTVERE